MKLGHYLNKICLTRLTLGQTDTPVQQTTRMPDRIVNNNNALQKWSGDWSYNQINC